MRFLDRPVDLDALKSVLQTMATAARSSTASLLIAELEILVDEAQRAFDRTPWDDRIIERWRALEEAIRQTQR